jgi:TPR repeat protein
MRGDKHLSLNLGPQPKPNARVRQDKLYTAPLLAELLRWAAYVSAWVWGMLKVFWGRDYGFQEAFVVVVLGLAANLLTFRRQKNLNLLDDIHAAQLWGSLKRHEAVEPFILYLRPFGRAEYIRLLNPMYSRDVFSLGHYMEPSRYGFENLLDSAFEWAGRLIALGKLKGSVGAGKLVVSEDDWQDCVKLLIKESRAVVIIPSMRPGTLFELDWLARSGQFTKSIFILPPFRLLYPEDWSKVRRVFSLFGFSFPDATKSGCLFVLQPDGTVLRAEELGDGSLEKIIAASHSLMEAIATNPAATPQWSLPSILTEAEAETHLITSWRRVIVRVTFIGLLLIMGKPQPSFYAGQRAFDQGNLEEAKEQLELLAQRGNIRAQVYLGRIYEESPVDGMEAEKWYLSAARQGDAEAQERLGLLLLRDYEESSAIYWIRKAAEQGRPKSQEILGEYYSDWQSVKHDYGQAEEWYRRAAEQGNSDAQAGLASLYMKKSVGVPQSYRQAAKWYRRAAEQGNSYAQLALARLLMSGKGLAQSNVEAYKWLKRAQSDKNFRDSATSELAKLIERMSPRERQEALH